MKVFDRYIFRSLLSATAFISLTLLAVVFLTQSLRFLELVIESSASSASFWALTVLALPRFFDIVLPIGLMAAIIFIYNRMTMDTELVVARAVGYSPMSLTRPALLLALSVTVFLWIMTMWAAPKALSSMQQMSNVIKSQLSTLLFREGVFNQAGKGLTVYLRQRADDGALHGLMIYDSREGARHPSTIMAKRGVVVANDGGNQVVVYNGVRHEYDPKLDILHRLNFQRYTIDLPAANPVRTRWREPDERTIFELLKPDKDNKRDLESLRNFKVEIHRRFLSPLLALVFTLISCCALLTGPINRRGQGKKIVLAISSVVCIQGLFLAGQNISRQNDWGLPFLYILVFLPMVVALFLLSGMSEKIRRRFLYRPNKLKGAAL